MTEKRGVPDRNLDQKPTTGRPVGRFSQSRSPLSPKSSKNVAVKAPEAEAQDLTPVRLRSRITRVLLDWRVVTTVGLVTTLGLTAVSTAFLLKIPALPNCPSIFWPLASASLRLHCAQLAASKRTAKDLIEAIELVGTLPKDHPLYEEASRWIEDWSRDLLDVAQEDFNNGNLKGAIASARKIPAHAAAAKQVDERIKQWEQIWKEAEAIEEKVNAFLKKRQPQNAFNEATKLLSIDCSYWQNKRYGELGERIATTRDEITKIGKAERALDNGSADDLLKALQDLETIPEKSPLYKDLEDLRPRIGKRMIALAEGAADRGRFDEALGIANKIPESLKIKDETDDFILLVGAQSKVAKGNSLEIEEAISQASRVVAGRPLYDRAQRLIARWQAEMRDIAQLARAQDLARSGNPEAIQAAIAEASNIGASNPKYREARDFIERESSKLQIKPTKFPTTPIATVPSPDTTPTGNSSGNSSGNSTAPSSVSPASQSALDQANSLAASGDLPGAIAAAQQVPATSPLYDQAQDRISKWQTRSDAEQGLQQAIAKAGAGNPEDLLDAISIAQQVPNNSPLKTQAKQSIDQWSEQVLQAAIGQAAYDAPGAITLASRIPSGTSAYGQAQSSISRWKKDLGQR
jgi:hypothetical protein